METVLEKLTAENKRLRSDVLGLTFRLMGEDESTFSPETAEIMDRWRPFAESILADPNRSRMEGKEG